MQNKADIQEAQYHFPYHHLSYQDKRGFFIFRHLFWGLEHYTYIKFVINEVCKSKVQTIADVGCGEGRIIFELESLLPETSFSGFDISAIALNFARGFTHRSGFSVHDITKEPLPTLFDAIVSCEVIEHIEPNIVDSYCKNIAASLKPDGLLFITTPTTNLPVNSKHYQHFTQESLSNCLSPYFTIEEVFFLNRVNFITVILNRILANRFFVSNFGPLNKWVLNTYRKHFLMGNDSNGTRIYIKAKKKS